MIRQRLRALGRAAGGRLSEGLSIGFVALLAAVVLAAILVTVASRDAAEPRGWAELTLTPVGCVVEPAQRLNVTRCDKVGEGVYRVLFSKSLEGSTVFASRGSCCPGLIGASINGRDSVLLAFGRPLASRIRVSVLVP